jgi:nicotinamide mononucleotide adenylyltransferase
MLLQDGKSVDRRELVALETELVSPTLTSREIALTQDQQPLALRDVRRRPPTIDECGSLVVFAGRFQPVHLGHVSTVIRLLGGDPDVAYGFGDRDLLRSLDRPIGVVIGVAAKRVEAKNFLSVGTRRRLIQIAFDGMDIHRVWTESLPNLDDPAHEAVYLRRSLAVPRAMRVVFATGNPSNYQSLGSAGLECLRLDNRPDNITATKIRELLQNGRTTELREMLPAGVLDALIEEQHDASLGDLLADRFGSVGGASA